MLNFDISNNVKEVLDNVIIALVMVVGAICWVIRSQRRDAKKESDDQ